ncbi:SDR family NAD(P)-dependent oxidoreductase [Fodinicola acaciae]|uniref:SDR family NAD(P)-dependent oxidoreductase n=1 Tax=Fodinicola acaciae TaxID=2681555 RepID=UPI0013D22CBD|nr:SDR family NAD(P)-dependent oxidoreductase [Fodinicola acaciae]
MTETNEPAGHSRRGLLRGAAIGAAGLAAGFGAGAAVGVGAAAPPYRPSGRRRFAGKVVLITGATSGIGRAAAIQFAAEGGKVGFCGRRVDRGRAVEAEIRAAGGEATYIRADVRVESGVRSFVDQIAKKYGGLHVAFNNAGVTIEKPVDQLSSAEFDQVVHTNLRGAFLATKYEIPHLVAAGGGVILVTSSSNALSTTENRAAYTASKRGIVGLVQSAAFDFAPKGIRVNALIPGTTDTELVRRAAGMLNAPESVWRVFAAQWAKSHVPGLGRMATADEVAAFALALASDDFPYMTGAQMVLDGGKTAHAG